MKPLLALLVFSFALQINFAQRYVNPDRLYYTQVDTSTNGSGEWKLMIYRFGDTININQKTYRKLEYSESQGLTRWSNAKSYYREKGDKVYWTSGSKEFLIYNWSAQIGDTIDTWICHKVFEKEQSIETEIGTDSCRLYDYIFGSKRIEFEGIGIDEHPFLTIELCSFHLGTGYLNCVYQGDELIFKRTKNRPCVPDATTGIRNVNGDKPPIRNLYHVNDKINLESIQGERLIIYSEGGRRIFLGGLEEAERFIFKSTGFYILQFWNRNDKVRTEKIIVH